MEFPDLGAQCAVKSCRMLDFLPVRCSGCQLVFCKDHYCFDCHSCPVGNSRDRQVPVCPLCGAPVPTGPNESADVKVGQHIDTSCKSQPALALKGKVTMFGIEFGEQ
uniref:AN1-type domain-containing protein n=1 Tax=Mesocestoides corti TaxID=53468 RepID=A0A5K3EG93_MESCO